jgi:hypothetical protein
VLLFSFPANHLVDQHNKLGVQLAFGKSLLLPISLPILTLKYFRSRHHYTSPCCLWAGLIHPTSASPWQSPVYLPGLGRPCATQFQLSKPSPKPSPPNFVSLLSPKPIVSLKDPTIKICSLYTLSSHYADSLTWSHHRFFQEDHPLA